jgi:hypothetical protein
MPPDSQRKHAENLQGTYDILESDRRRAASSAETG